MIWRNADTGLSSSITDFTEKLALHSALFSLSKQQTTWRNPFKGQQGPSGAAGFRHATNPAQFCGHNADVNSALNIKELYI